MAQVILTIPDAVVPRIRTAFAAVFVYTGTHNGQPETQAQFMHRQIREWIKGVVTTHERQAALVAADEATRAAIDTDIVLS